jgi:hypothetical protein
MWQIKSLVIEKPPPDPNPPSDHSGPIACLCKSCLTVVAANKPGAASNYTITTSTQQGIFIEKNFFVQNRLTVPRINYKLQFL